MAHPDTDPLRFSVPEGGAFMRDELLRPADVQAEYNIKATTLESWRRRGVGPASFKLIGCVFYRRSAIERWLAECEAGYRVSP